MDSQNQVALEVKEIMENIQFNHIVLKARKLSTREERYFPKVTYLKNKSNLIRKEHFRSLNKK